MSNGQCMDSKETIDDSESIASDESEEMTGKQSDLENAVALLQIKHSQFSKSKEVDEDEFDHRRAACIADMKELELQYSKLKEELINERNKMVNKKLKEIEDETAEEFTKPLKQLQMNIDFKIKLTSKPTFKQSFLIQLF